MPSPERGLPSAGKSPALMSKSETELTKGELLMSYHDLLNQYGQEQKSAEQRIYIYAQAPKSLTTTKEVVYRESSVRQTIGQLEKMIADLKDYQIALAARYAELETMSYQYRLELTRCPHWKGCIEYFVRIVKTLEDGSEIEELREKYSGKDRYKAIARFEELKKQRPGIEAIKDIEKRHWEK